MDFNDFLQQEINFFKKNNFGNKRENFEAALELQPDNAVIKELADGGGQNILIQEEKAQAGANDVSAKSKLALVYYARAIADFEMVLKYKPDDNTARELLEMVKAEMAKNK